MSRYYVTTTSPCPAQCYAHGQCLSRSRVCRGTCRSRPRARCVAGGSPGEARPRFSQAGGLLLFHLLHKLYKRVGLANYGKTGVCQTVKRVWRCLTLTELLDKWPYQCYVPKTGNECYQFRHLYNEMKSRMKATVSARTEAGRELQIQGNLSLSPAASQQTGNTSKSKLNQHW